jgi:FMN phosphatase YigB (HAD superfamily)
MLSFDVYGTLVNTPPANLDAFRTILVDAGRSDLDPNAFYSFWEQRNIAHYYELYRTYKDICRLSLSEAYEKFGVTAGRYLLNPGLLRLRGIFGSELSVRR